MNKRILEHWQQLRQRSYDLLASLAPGQLELKLGFERSQSIYYQYWCMLGAQESWLALFESGQWAGFACSLTGLEGARQPDTIRRQMQAADARLIALLQDADLQAAFENGSTRLDHYLSLVEHESHHQGQLINFIYAHDLDIPQSWFHKWHLTRD